MTESPKAQKTSAESRPTQQERQRQSSRPNPLILERTVLSTASMAYTWQNLDIEREANVLRETNDVELKCRILKPTEAERVDLMYTMLSRQIGTTLGEF